MTRISTTGYMGTPKIVYPAEGRWQELYGHACVTVDEAEEYCSVIGGGSMRVVYDGEELPECPPAPPKKAILPFNPSPATIAAVQAILAELDKPLPLEVAVAERYRLQAQVGEPVSEARREAIDAALAKIRE